ERARDCVETVHAGAALAGAGAGQIPHRPGRLADAARARRQDDDCAGAEPSASRPEVGLEQGRIGGLVLAEPAAEEAADEEGSNGSGGVKVGLARPRLRNWMSAVSSPATNPSGTATARRRTRLSSLPPRSAIALERASSPSRSARETATIASRAPTACAAATAPSSTRCGKYRTRTLSLPLMGSPSVPFATTTGRPRRAATARSFLAAGKP